MYLHDDTIHSIQPCVSGELALPLHVFLFKVQAGFPSPAEDYMEGTLDLNEYLIKHKAATFFVRAAGDSMINAGIFPDDLLIVDRAIEPRSGHIVIAALNGELTVKRLRVKEGLPLLCPENPSYPPITFSSFDELHIWGVVTNVVHSTL